MEKRERQKRRRKKSRKALLKEIMIHELIVITVMIFLVGLYFLLSETGVLSKHTFQRVEDITECEEVKFENLLFTYIISMYNPVTGKDCYEMLCIFNTGDVYCFYLPDNNYYDFVYFYDSQYGDGTWELLADPIYLGHFSAFSVQRLNNCVTNYDENSECYSNYKPFYGGWEQSIGQESTVYTQKITEYWLAYHCWIYYEDDCGGGKDIIKHYEGDIRLMDGVLRAETYDKYGARAIRIFESSWFYDELLKICPF